MAPTTVAPGEQLASPIGKVTHQPLQFLQEVRRGHAIGMASDLRAALEVYQPGMNYRDLGKAMHHTDDEARLLWQELKRRGLLRTSREQEPAEQEHPPQSQGPASEESGLEQALRAYDEGYTTIDALAVALGKTPWMVRPLYQQVKKLRGQKVG
jgi:hypothetical protein